MNADQTDMKQYFRFLSAWIRVHPRL